MKDDIQRYIACMEVVKQRMAVISDWLERRRTTGYAITDAEFMCLQFRKVLELIALASLCANRREYERIRQNFHSDWRADKILRDIEKVNPKFYPQPSQQIKNLETGEVGGVASIQEGYLTRGEFEAVFNECADLLHAFNPYRTRLPDLTVLNTRFLEWQGKIVKLLSHHQVQLVDDDKQLWVIMQDERDGKVHVAEMQKAENGA